MMPRVALCLAVGAALLSALAPPATADSLPPLPAPADDAVRVAQWNVALSRRGAGVLLKDLRRGRDPQLRAIAEVLGAIRPDVLILNEVDHDPGGAALAALQGFLAGQGLDYPHAFAGPVNTGIPSGLDLDGDGRSTGAADAQGFGRFPGQYGMAVLSRFPLDTAGLRDFRLLGWRDVPGVAEPRRADGSEFPSAAAAGGRRLSSKAHWDLAVTLPGIGPVGLLVSHPTPPVFDDAHDLNGYRNAGEIRLWLAYLDGVALTDAAGRHGPRPDRPVILAGDLNADPADGDGQRDAIRALLAHPALQDPAPRSAGGAAAGQGGADDGQRGDPARDTAVFDPRGPGNLRVDYLLPDARLSLRAAGVYWPDDPGAGALLARASDHRPIWADLAAPAP